jgi:inosose dehydratase
MQLGYHTITWGGVVGSGVGVTSIKDLFYLANGSTEDALRDVKSAGYAGVELFDGNLVAGHEDGSLRRLLDETGLQLIAAYSGANFIFPDVLEDEFWRLERAMSLAAEYGAPHFVVGGGAQRAGGNRERDYERLAEGLDRVAELADRRGLVASYHPHLSTMAETPDQIEQVLSRSAIRFCPDTAHQLAAGGDPAELIRRYGDRIEYVHLKDVRRDPLAFLPLGDGDLDLPDVVRALREIEFDGWLTIELDEYQGPPVEAAARSLAVIQELLDAQPAPPPRSPAN